MLCSHIASANLVYAALVEAGIFVHERLVWCHLAHSFYNHDERRVTHARAN